MHLSFPSGMKILWEQGPTEETAFFLRGKKCFKYLFIYLAVPDLSCSRQDLVPRPGIEPGVEHHRQTAVN